MNVDGGRTNVIICQALIVSDVETFGRQAVGHLTMRRHLKFGNGEVRNIRCVDTQGNIFDYPTVLGGYLSNDGRESITWMSFHQYIGNGAFNPQPGSPVTISIVADLHGWQTGDVLEVSIDDIDNIIAEGNYWSPMGEVKSSILMLSQAAVVDAIRAVGTTLEIVAHMPPNTACDIEGCDAVGKEWHKLNPTPLVSSETGEVLFDYVGLGRNAKFFRVRIQH